MGKSLIFDHIFKFISAQSGFILRSLQNAKQYRIWVWNDRHFTASINAILVPQLLVSIFKMAGGDDNDLRCSCIKHHCVLLSHTHLQSRLLGLQLFGNVSMAANYQIANMRPATVAHFNRALIFAVCVFGSRVMNCHLRWRTFFRIRRVVSFLTSCKYSGDSRHHFA